MYYLNLVLMLLVILSAVCECSRILAIFSCPSVSHQVVFRPLTHELARRGHEVVVVTTDPAFKKGETPKNLTEIDVHDLSYSIWRKNVMKSDVTRGKEEDMVPQMELFHNLLIDIFEQQMYTKELQEILKDESKGFDLILVEAIIWPALAFSHKYKAPVIQMSSFLPLYNNMDTIGAPTHPFLYPIAVRQKLNNLSLWDKIQELYTQYRFESMMFGLEEKQNAAIQRVFGKDTPHLRELFDNIHMLFLNTYAIWDSNRPVPPSCLYLGGLHRKPEKELPKELKAYLDKSKNGVIYISYGTNVSPSALPPHKMQILTRVFAKLPYDVLWKWDKDEMPGKPPNVKLMKWLPQSDLLRHPNIKLFITQGGLQSTDEAIAAGVPMIGMPMLVDQWFNSERYVQHKIGLRLDLEDLTEKRLEAAINAIVHDDSYRQNVRKLYELMEDQPQSPLDRAVWWTEHVLRHGGAAHLRAPAANLAWSRYYELPLLATVFVAILGIVAIITIAIYYCIKFIIKSRFVRKKLKSN